MSAEPGPDARPAANVTDDPTIDRPATGDATGDDGTAAAEDPSGADIPVVDDRPADLVLARLHLRLGSLTLARAELETLAGRDALDADGLVDLAEVRWRTGDISGAGEAAVAALDDEDGPLLALVVAAEAAAARGRPTEARRLADRVLAVADGSIDDVFAGMPRGGVWPPDAAAPPPAPTTMFDPPHLATRGVGRSSARPPAAARTAAGEALGRASETVPPIDTSTLRMWDDAETPDAATRADHDIQPGSLSGADSLDLGRSALDAGDLDDAVLRLSLVLRVSPALAPAIIDLVAERPERMLALVRGDAYRLVGREIEALRAYADAAGSDTDPDRPDPGHLLPEPDHPRPQPDPDPPPEPDSPPEGDPA